MTTFPQPSNSASTFSAFHDAWNRMTSISSGGSTVATYQYDGLGRRIVKVTAAISETRHFYYTNNWQDVEERVGTSTSMGRQYVWGVRYVDELVCRDDETPQRLYACQDANYNLTAITDTSGGVGERYLFDPYGNRTIMTGSWGIIAFSGYAWIVAWQGLELQAESGLVLARFRLSHPACGSWLSRDQTEYTGGPHLYQLEGNNPVTHLDPAGLTDYIDAFIQWANNGVIGNWWEAINHQTGRGGAATFSPYLLSLIAKYIDLSGILYRINNQAAIPCGTSKTLSTLPNVLGSGLRVLVQSPNETLLNSPNMEGVIDLI